MILRLSQGQRTTRIASLFTLDIMFTYCGACGTWVLAQVYCLE